ncbi:ATP-binding protein [Streptomyces sp. 549]|uniref:ATP-binding protein n=1 Tax=Streptomyces sp. 549 TaxID=3049076 RepID=UPI0024C4076C|nr:ATP-binding protein [Streptomyces sp. 549]MDK1472571.1 ATP-binding protein [Streptomyces sp. 549]
MTAITELAIAEPTVGSYRMCAPNVPETAKVGRDIVASLLRATGHPQLVDVARLLVSEVVANVHLHTRVPALTLVAAVRRDGLWVAVRDGEPRLAPRLRPVGGEQECGRGLPLLDVLASAWGVTWHGQPEPTGKSVWFELRDGTAVPGAG